MTNIQYQLNTSGSKEFDAILYDNNGVYTGVINSTGTVYTNSHANVVLQDLINNLSSGSSVNANGYSTGGTYGEIRVGPGIYNIYSSVILQPNISIRGSGAWATIFQWPNGAIPNNNTGIMFKGANWDTQSVSTTLPNSTTAYDSGIRLRDFQIFGNWGNNTTNFPSNQSPSTPNANTQTTTLITGVETAGANGVAGAESWGHGICLYATDAWLDGLLIHNCPGAGVILQSATFLQIDLGGGNEFPYGTASNVGFITTNRVTNTNCWNNGRQGLCLRAQTYVDRYWAYENGEAGIDFQSCQYFGAGGWVSNIEMFFDSGSHGTLSSSTYDPLSFEMRMTNGTTYGGPSFLTNCWIEGPAGPGDNLALGTSIAPTNPTGWQISNGSGGIEASNLYLDGVRWSGIYIPHNVSFCTIQAHINGAQTSGTAYGTPQTPVKLDGASYNTLDITSSGFNGTIGGSPDGIVVGSSTVGSWGNRIKYTARWPEFMFNWQAIGNKYNTIEAYVDTSFSPVNVVVFSNSTGPNVNYTNNDINISAPFSVGGVNGGNSGSGTASLLTHNGGTATFSGTGSQTAFNIAHNLVAQPLVFIISPGSAAASGAYALTATTTNLVVTYTTAPASGTNNVVINWNARVSP